MTGDTSTLPKRFALRGRFLFTADGSPLRDGIIWIDGPKIAAVGDCGAAEQAIDLGNVAILPGLVNAHTHLEFSDLTSLLGAPSMPFPNWIAAVIAWRRNRSEADHRAAVLQGLDESIRSGTTTLGEIATTGWPLEVFANAGDSRPEATVFFELLGISAARSGEHLETARRHLSLAASHGVRGGLSPHAPYTVRPEVVQQLASISAAAPLAMHLAESREELEFLTSGTGPFRDLLASLGVWDPTAIPPGSRPLDYLRLLSAAERTLVIHGNYLDDEEIAYLAAHSERMALVYCPRTHAYFGHASYPLAKLLDAGVVVALGTDSRASNPDLSILAEMRHVAEHHAVPPHRIIEMATLNGAKALGLDQPVGNLFPGKFADLAIVRLPDAAGDDPYELLFDPRANIETVVRSGTVVHGRRVPASWTDGSH